MRTFRTIVIAVITLASLGCDTKKQSELRVNNVVRVFMHESNRYTLFAQQHDAKELSVFTLSVSEGYEYQNDNGTVLARCAIHLQTDVSPGEPMWVTSERWGDVSPGDDCIVTIHLHDPTEVEGGEWTQRRGKQTVHGTTQTIE